MTKLKRGFLNAKRVLCIGLNYNTREPWLLDYVKSIGKGMQDLNNNEVDFEKDASEYVLYNGQQLSLKTYVDDKVDIVDRRTLIGDNPFESYAFYGYFSESLNEWVYEVDPNPTSFYGYLETITDGTSEWVRETLDPYTNPSLYGYSKAINGDFLIDLIEDPITDILDELLYTLDNGGDLEYKWFRETPEGNRLTILIHNDIFTTLSTEEKDSLKERLKRYIIAPIDNLFGIEGYS